MFSKVETLVLRERNLGQESFSSGVYPLRNQDNEREKSKMETDDGWNRTFYGNPTIGGIIVVIIIGLYLIFQ